MAGLGKETRTRRKKTMMGHQLVEFVVVVLLGERVGDIGAPTVRVGSCFVAALEGKTICFGDLRDAAVAV